MAAQDTFETYVSSLTQLQRETLKELIRTRREELMAARSEDARVRIVYEFIEEVREELGLEQTKVATPK